MYLAEVSVRRVEDITQPLWGTRVSASMVSYLNQKIYKQIRGVAPAAAGGRASACLPGWFVAEALVGRRGEERLCAGGYRRGTERRGQGGQGRLDGISARTEGARIGVV